MAGDETSAAMLAAAAVKARSVVDPQPDLLGLPMTQRRRDVLAGKPGRPPGARNKRREDIARFVLEEIGDPLLHQAALAVMPADELAAAAGCSIMEAVTEKRLAAAVVLPYLHQRQAVAVDFTGHVPVFLTLVDGSGPVNTAPLTIVDVVENQQVSEGDGDAV